MEILLIASAALFGVGVSYFVLSKSKKTLEDNSVSISSDIGDLSSKNADNSSAVIEAKAKAMEIIIEAKDRALKLRSKAEEDARRIRSDSIELEKKLAVQKAQVESRERDFDSKFKQLKAAKENLDRKQSSIEEELNKIQTQLERVSSLSKDEARKILLDNLEKELVSEKGKKIKEFEDVFKGESEELSKKILIDAMSFGTTDIVVEYSTSKVKLPDEDIKGRIIGKEGRNIKRFEEMTGVDLDMDSSPGDIIVSCFDPVRREIARIALEKLIADGRIQPARIEEVIENTQKELEHVMYKAGDDLCHKVGLYNVPKELIQLLGKFKYRFSYGQNMLEHTLETARIGSYIANELGANVEVVKAGCIFHDIGKVIMDKEGTHVDLGVEILQKFKIDPKVISCVGEHHNDNHTSVESAIVALADHISGARPGSRGEDYESYVKRLKNLEEAALSFDGVDKAYAVSAGREVRVFVSPDRVDDYSTAYLAKEIAKKIELEQTYPGTVKVIVIRETRVSETAK